MSQNYQYNTIEEALRDLKEGKIVHGGQNLFKSR